MGASGTQHGKQKKRRRQSGGGGGRKLTDLAKEPESQAGAVTIAQHILHTTPFHKQAVHGRKEQERKKKTETETAAATKVTLRTQHIHSVVDGWISRMLKDHGEEEQEEAEEEQEEQELRPARLGLGASFVAHTKALEVDPRQKKATERIERALAKQKAVKEAAAKEREEKEEEEQQEESRSAAVGMKRKREEAASGEPVKKKKKKKKKKAKEAWSDKWY